MLHRIVEDQASYTPIRTLTDTQEEYEFLENLVEASKPVRVPSAQHYLIRTQFRYPLPVLPEYTARFRPPFSYRNIFYGSSHRETSFYETAYHWLRERVHIPKLSQRPEPRTLFAVKYEDPQALHLETDPNVAAIMDRHDYSASHAYVERHPECTSIVYPSCRDPEHRLCAAVFDPATLGEKPLSLDSLFLVYLAATQSCQFIGPNISADLIISWDLVR